MWRKDGVRHANFVVSTVFGKTHPQPRALEDYVARSWTRSIEQYKLDPSRASKPRILTAGSIKNHRGPLEDFLSFARHGITKLHEQLRDAGYVILLTDAHGVTVDFAGDPALGKELKSAGLYLGSWWSEDEEGTNGVGTCIMDRVPIVVHKDEHFRAPNIDLTCTAAPIFDTEGKVLAVLDASALRSPDEKNSQLLVLQLVKHYAGLIENANFLHCYRNSWVMSFSRSNEFLDVQTDCLIAFDESGAISGANRNACREIAGDADTSLNQRRVSELFMQPVEEILGRGALPAAPLHLRCGVNARHYFAKLRAPLQTESERSAPAPAAATQICELDQLAGNDPAMLRNIARAKRVTDKDIPVLLLGDTGTGKEVFAKALHHYSHRADKPFIAVNCAAIPEALIESELFGYKDGAFTGARSKGMRGKLLQANGGTLFLDEIGDMPLALQSRLLRVLAEKEVVPLGAELPVNVDLQVICATHRNPQDMVESGQFREDLYFRLAGITLKLPALRERGDRETLIHNLLRQEAADRHPLPAISPAALAALLAYPWPGNIRQLRNALRFALAINNGAAIELDDLPPEIAGTVVPTPRAHEDSGDERERLIAVLRRHHWEVSASARELDVCRATLYRRMKRLDIVPPNRQPE